MFVVGLRSLVYGLYARLKKRFFLKRNLTKMFDVNTKFIVFVVLAPSC